jgi:hypothetical protein
MTEGERRALRVLALVCAAAAASLALYYGVERINDERTAMEDYRSRIARLSGISVDEEGAKRRLREIESLLGKAEGRSAAIANTPVPEFGHEALALFSRNAIRPAKYLVVSERGGNELEFSFQCDAVDLLRFLREATDDEKGWAVPYVSIHADSGDGRAEVAMRLAP